jgi:phosphatidylinositol-3-phosphatase
MNVLNLFRSHRALAVASVLSAATLMAPCNQPASTTRMAMPPIKHVFVIVLENEGFDTTFAPTTRATYLADTLVKQGALLRQYFAIGHYSLDNYLAIISGMPATAQTQMDCPKFVDFVQTGTSPDGQPVGAGCVYPANVKTIANQLDARAFTWRGYMEDMGADSTREAATCGHPAVGGIDSTEWATPKDQYATKHNPFMYFHAVIDSPACKHRIVPLPALLQDLQSASTTPNFSFITPNLCHDGHDHPCVNGEPGGLESANLFLKHWVPIIMKSPAFRDDGLLIITFDEALSIDRSSCCGQVAGPNARVANDGQFGGGRIGAVMISRFIAPGTVSDVPYNHYSLLRSVEDIFGLGHLGYAQQRTVTSFGDDVFGSAAAAGSGKAPRH